MKVAMVGPFGFAPKKTMRSRAFRLARELVLRGHQVRIIMPPWHTPEQAAQTWTESGVQISYVALHGGRLRSAQRMLREVLDWQPNVVHCFKPKAHSGMVAEWLWRFHRNKLRIVIDMDDWEGWGGWNELEDYPRLVKHLFAKQEQWGMQRCHALTVASRTLESLAWGTGVSHDKVVYLPNGTGLNLSEQWIVNSKPFTSQPRNLATSQPTILLYSRLFEFDVARLVAILSKVQTKVADLRLLMVGASLQVEDGKRFERLMQQAGLLGIVEDVGWVEEEKLPGVLCSAETAVYLMDDTLLNRTKCPVKLADLCALGIPTVAEAVGQVKEYIDNGRSGFLHPTGDIDAIAASLITLLQKPRKRQQFAKASRQHMQQFAWDKLAQRLEQAYE